jgi:hypothetical protein
MVIYKCSICFKEFNRKSSYDNHKKRKNPCTPPNKTDIDITNRANICTAVQNVARFDKICIFCSKSYKRNSELNRHLKTCKEKKDNILKEQLFQLLLKMDKQEELQKERQREYKKQIEKLESQINNIPASSTVNNYTYNTNNTQNIQVLAYDKTDISHLKDKDYKKVLKRGNFCVPNLVDAIHFNPQKPENHNIYIPNMKTGFIMCWNGKSWDIRNREDIIDEIYEDKSNLLIDKVEEWEEIGYKLDPGIMIKFKRFMEKKELDKVKDKVKEDLRFLLYNKRNDIKNKQKKN